MKIRPNPLFPQEPKELSIQLGVVWRELARAINELITAFDGAATGGAGGGGGRRWGSGIDTTDYVIIDDSDVGLVLKSPDGHYWLFQVNNTGNLVTTDLGVVKP